MFTGEGSMESFILTNECPGRVTESMSIISMTLPATSVAITATAGCFTAWPNTVCTWPVRFGIHGLLHDAYLGDIPGPFKPDLRITKRILFRIDKPRPRFFQRFMTPWALSSGIQRWWSRPIFGVNCET